MVIAAAVLSVMKMELAAVWVGIAFTVIGSVMSKRKEKGYRAGSYYAAGLGVVFILWGLIFYMNGFSNSQSGAGLFVLFPLLFVATGGYVAIVWHINKMYRKRRCTQTVDSLIVRFKTYTSTDDDGHTSESYAPVFRYEFNNREYEKVSPATSSRKPQLNIRQKIFINPENPKEIFDPVLEKGGPLFEIIFGLIFAAAGFYVLFQVLFSGQI